MLLIHFEQRATMEAEPSQLTIQLTTLRVQIVKHLQERNPTTQVCQDATTTMSQEGQSTYQDHPQVKQVKHYQYKHKHDNEDR